MKFKRRKCRLCDKQALQNRTICWTHKLESDRKKREDKLAKQAISKVKKKVRHEQSIEGKRELMKKAWKLQSRAVRMEAADENGMCLCYTCEQKFHWKDCQLGHYIHGALDFDLERNLRIQCGPCNNYKYGNKNLAIFGIKLAEELGVEGMKKLRLDSNTFGNEYTCQQLKEIIEKYSTKTALPDTQGVTDFIYQKEHPAYLESNNTFGI